ncbi:MAG: hypothetical protein WD512_10055, partial [Candidatus Paceibacterota bacterium]
LDLICRLLLFPYRKCTKPGCNEKATTERAEFERSEVLRKEREFFQQCTGYKIWLVLFVRFVLASSYDFILFLLSKSVENVIPDKFF